LISGLATHRGAWQRFGNGRASGTGARAVQGRNVPELVRLLSREDVSFRVWDAAGQNPCK